MSPEELEKAERWMQAQREKRARHRSRVRNWEFALWLGGWVSAIVILHLVFGPNLWLWLLLLIDLLSGGCC